MDTLSIIVGLIAGLVVGFVLGNFCLQSIAKPIGILHVIRYTNGESELLLNVKENPVKLDDDDIISLRVSKEILECDTLHNHTL